MSKEQQQELFNYLYNELGVTALESNLNDIEDIINPRIFPYLDSDKPAPRKLTEEPNSKSTESIGEDEAIKQAAYENCKLHYIMALSDELISASTIDFEAGVEWQKNHSDTPNEMVDKELSIDEIENVVSKGLDENYYHNLPKNKYEMVGKDELVEKFKNSLGINSIDEDAEICAKIALQYHQSKIEELENKINSHIKWCEENIEFLTNKDAPISTEINTNPYKQFLRLLKQIKSL